MRPTNYIAVWLFGHRRLASLTASGGFSMVSQPGSQLVKTKASDLVQTAYKSNDLIFRASGLICGQFIMMNHDGFTAPSRSLRRHRQR